MSKMKNNDATPQAADPQAAVDPGEHNNGSDETTNNSKTISTTLSALEEVSPEVTVHDVLRILGLRPTVKDYIQNEYPTVQNFENFLELSSEEITAMTEESGNGGDFVCVRFNQADRAKLILLRRWWRSDDHSGGDQKLELGDLNRESFDSFARNIDAIILDEILNELHLNEMKDTLKNKGIHTPASFVELSKHWFEHDDGVKDVINSTQVAEIERFKKWYQNYQLDTYLPSDWIVSFRVDRMKETEMEWRRVLKATGLSNDTIYTLEINGVCDFGTLNRKSGKWRVSESAKKWLQCNSVTDPMVFEWKKLGLKESDARNIIQFRHWFNFYARGKGIGSNCNWTLGFSSKHYNNFVGRYIDPNKLDDFKKPNFWESRYDELKASKERTDYLDMLQIAVEDGSISQEHRYRLRQHYNGRKEKMELIQEIGMGSGDTSYQEERLNEILQKEAESDKHEKAEYLLFIQNFCQFFFSALVVYVLLIIWVGTILYFMIQVDDYDPGSEDNTYAIFIHNITFGLVTAVVIQELGEEMKETSLYSRFLPVYEERLKRSKETRFQNWLKLRSISFRCRNSCYKLSGLCIAFWEISKDIFTWLILMSARVFILTWITWGAVSLCYGVGMNLEATNPLYTTGQTWAGIAVTIGYSYFGLSDKEAKVKEDETPETETDTQGENDLAINGNRE